MMKITASIFKTLFLCLCIIANTHLAYAQTASILPPAKTQFLDNNGKPLTSGTVDFYIPSTTTRKTTWQNSGETISNTNPVILDAGGRAIIYGDGTYRQVVKDRLGNLIWDQLTSSTGSGSGGGSTATGDGDLVGTIKPWAGLAAPNQYAFTYGQELSRASFSSLFIAITSTQAVFCQSGNPILTGLADTTNFPIGAPVEVSCLAAGFSTIISKTSSSITLAANPNVTTNTSAVIFPWGNGNHTTTFNVPDFRGVPIAGNNNMGGVASGKLTTTYFGTDPNSIGASGGSQFHSIITGEMPAHNHPVFLFDPGHNHGLTQIKGNSFSGGGVNALTAAGSPQSLSSDANVTGITVRDASANAGNANQTNFTGGGIANTAAIANVGSGYTNGSQTLTVTGGVCSVQPQFTVIVSGGALSGTPALLTAGACSIAPVNPASFTGAGGGTGGTLTVNYLATPISLVQPTVTANYIIKTTPDANSATASGVTSLGGMTGSIACGAGLTCTGNNISISGGGTGTVTSVALAAPSIFIISGSPVTTTGTLTLTANGTSGGVPYFNSATTMASSALLTANALMIGGGAGAAPTVLGSLGTTSTLLHGNAVGSPSYGQIVTADVTTNNITNSLLAQAAAWTLKGNASSSTANEADFTIASLTAKASPVSGDLLIISDSAASGALKQVTVSSIASAGSVSSIAGNTGAFTLNAASGLTNTVNDIKCNQASSSQFGCAEVDNVTLLATSGVLGQKATSLANSLSSDVALNNTANYFTGPTVTQGTSGTWYVSGTVTVADTGVPAAFDCRLTDGTTNLAASRTITTSAGNAGSISLSGIIVSPAGNLSIQCKDTTATTGVIRANATGNGNKDSTITAYRIQ